MPTTTNIGESGLIMQMIEIGIVAIPTVTMRVVHIAMSGIEVLSMHIVKTLVFHTSMRHMDV